MGCALRLVGVAGSLSVSLSYKFSPFLARKGVMGMVVPMAIGISTLPELVWLC